jgi:hypothetical protein
MTQGRVSGSDQGFVFLVGDVADEQRGDDTVAGRPLGYPVPVPGDQCDGIAGNPVIASWGPGRLDAFWWRNDNTLQHGWNDNGGDPASWGWEQFALQYPGYPPS